MKPALAIVLLATVLAPSAHAGDMHLKADDPSVNLAAALGKQVNVQFSEEFAKGRLPRADYEGVVISEAPEGKICLFGRPQGIEPDAPALAGFGRETEGDICVSRSDVTLKSPDAAVSGAPRVPFYSTDKASCSWVWKTGRGIGLWTEDCTFETGRWDVAYDEANDWFALRVNGADPFPVVRQFRIAGGVDALLPDLKSRGLILDDAECVFSPATDQPVPAGWSGWEVTPVGKRKQEFEALPSDEVPEPPCGELGMAVDFTGFFLTHKDHAGRVLYVNLGQDGTMIDLASLSLTD